MHRNHPAPRPARRHRRWAPRLLALAVGGATVVGGAGLALAEDWDAPADAEPTQTTETPAAKAARETRDAIDKAKDYVKDGRCLGFIGNYADGNDASSIINALDASVPPRIVDKHAQDERRTINGKQYPIAADVRGGSNGTGVGAGAAGTLTLYKAFHDAPAYPATFYNVSEDSDDQMYVLTKEQWRAMIVLHELMHLTGNLDGSHNGNLAALQEGIVKNCIPDAERKPFTADSPPGTRWIPTSRTPAQPARSRARSTRRRTSRSATTSKRSTCPRARNR
jgi:hypothetical protein